MAKNKDKASIYVDVQELFKKLYYAQFEIPKRDRIALTNRMLEHCERMIGYFALSYHTERKLENADMFIAEFEALKIEIRMAIDDLFKSEGTKMNLRESIVKIEDGIERWRVYVSGYRQEPRPGVEVSTLKS